MKVKKGKESTKVVLDKASKLYNTLPEKYAVKSNKLKKRFKGKDSY